ncbi:MAG: PspA/IM30 family protein [Psychrobium sp.]
MMQLIQKLSTAMRGGTREVLESAVDANALRILAQEIYECETSMRQSKQHLANVVVEKLSVKRQIDAQKAKSANKEAAIRQKLEQGDEAGAMQLAESLAAQESMLEKQQAQYEQLEDYESNLLQALKNTANNLGEYRAELNMAKATQQAQMSVGKLSVHKNVHSDSFARMDDSLQRIRQKQETFDDKMQAMQDIDAYVKGESTQQQQRSQQAKDILARLKD